MRKEVEQLMQDGYKEVRLQADITATERPQGAALGLSTFPGGRGPTNLPSI